MGQPFYVRYIKEFENRLYYHAYDESREMFWCDKTTGMSPNVWGRAVGWFVMALVDVLELLEGELVDSKPLKMILQETLDGMLPYQHSGGMWYQVVDMGDRLGNYLESSGTLMIAYALLKGSRLGYLAKEYADYGKSAFNGTIQQYLREENGEVLLGGICRSAGLGKNPDTGKVRDGSFKYYTENEIIVSNNGHGVAPLLMAYSEVKMSEL
ncbi:Unsaturated rhamnogalacturonyl hydrolase YteR [compost metagenome]